MNEHPILEPMGAFFDRRADGYEEHQMTAVDGGRELYPFTASLLPVTPGAKILDLGCGTGLELDAYFPLNPTASVTGFDLSEKLTAELMRKHGDRDVTVKLASYFDEPFGTAAYDAAVSVMSLHHFTMAQKIPLYRKLKDALKPGGVFVLSDYLAPDEEFGAFRFSELERLKKLAGIGSGESCHFDTPLTFVHETEALLEGGFSSVEKLAQWGNTVTLLAK